MAGRHSDVLALYGGWIGLGLVATAAIPLVALPFRTGQTVLAGMYVLTGVVFAGQGAILCRSPGQYVGRHLAPPPIERLHLENRPAVYLFGIVALVLGVLLTYLGLALLRVTTELPT